MSQTQIDPNAVEQIAAPAETQARKPREPRLIDTVINPDGKPGIQGWAFAALQHSILNGPNGQAKSLAYVLVNNKDGLVQRMADERKRANLKGVSGGGDTYKEVVDFLILKGERGKKDVFTPNFLKIVEHYANAPTEALLPRTRTPRTAEQTAEAVAKVEGYKAGAQRALEFAATNLKYNQDLAAQRKTKGPQREVAAVAPGMA